MKTYIINECKKQNIIIPTINIKKLNETELEIYSDTYLEKVKYIIENSGGKILSKKYLTKYDKIKICCKRNHIKFVGIDGILKDKKIRCMKCYELDRLKYNINDAIEIAKNHNGKFLSEIFSKGNIKYLWECQFNHKFYKSFGAVKLGGYGSWCPYCSGCAKKSIIDMREIAKQHNGKFISLEYINHRIKYIWECINKHRWESTYMKAKRFWCIECKNNCGSESNA